MRALRIVSSLLFAAFGLSSITDCSNGASLLKLTELGLLPDPPVRGQPLDMTVKFENPGDEIVDGTVTTSVTLNYIPFQPTVEALCANTQCPLAPGANDRSTSSTWPDNVSGSVTSKIVWTGVDGSQLLCIQIKANIGAVAKLRGSTNVTQEDADNIAYMWWPQVVLDNETEVEYPTRPLKCGLYDNKAVGPWLNMSLANPSF
jgi:hypothetical protein